MQIRYPGEERTQIKPNASEDQAEDQGKDQGRGSTAAPAWPGHASRDYRNALSHCHKSVR